MLNRLTLSAVAVAVIAGTCLLGCAPVAEAVGPKVSPMTAAEKQRVKQAVSAFTRLHKSKQPSPAVLAEARKHAGWLKNYARKNPARVQAAVEKVMAKGSLSAAQKSELQKRAKAKGGYAGVVADLAGKIHTAAAPKSADSILPTDPWCDIFFGHRFCPGVPPGVSPIFPPPFIDVLNRLGGL